MLRISIPKKIDNSSKASYTGPKFKKQSMKSSKDGAKNAIIQKNIKIRLNAKFRRPSPIEFITN